MEDKKLDISKIEEDYKKNQLSEDDKMLKELEAQGKKYIKEINEKFDLWYGKNRDYLMREYIGEHQEEFRDFCGKIFMEDKEDKVEELNEDFLKIDKDKDKAKNDK